MKRLMSLALSVSAAVAVGSVFAAPPAGAAKNIILIHGAFADGAGWRGVAEILEKDGYHVTVAQPPETSLDDDVTSIKRLLALQDGPTVLVGHSYGGAIATQAGNDPKVAALVFVAAMAPDEGESVLELLQQTPGASTAITPTADGYFYIDPARFHADFAADLPASQAHFMAMSQVFTNGADFTQKITTPAWKTKPSWAIVSTDDRTINPDLERFMYKRAGSHITEINASHAVYASRAKETAAVIEKAAIGVKGK